MKCNHDQCVSGYSTAMDDYVHSIVSGIISPAQSASSFCVSIATLPDQDIEGTETFNIQLNSDYSTEQSNATVYILDNDGQHLYSIYLSSMHVCVCLLKVFISSILYHQVCLCYV